ncbi:MAG: hypothetical protein JSR59_07650 [Proteobacteria bacterium]|nr:hypothetical protein [Pseudomonadota bacterium]
MIDHDPEARPDAPLEQAPMPSRRRLLRGGLAAAPVMLTLASRPVRAGGSCKAASAFASINLSGHKTAGTCTGHQPPYWQGTSSWPGGCQASGSNATQFSAIFTTGNVYPGKTMMQVMNMNGTTGTSGVARYLCAAYLNASATLTPQNVLSQATATSVWTSFINKGYYEPTAGVQWNSDQIISWVNSTMS